MNYNKKYDVGSTSLAAPFFDYYHTLPLVAFGDVKSSVELSFVYNSMLGAENHFNIGNGFKLNLQKKLLINGTTIQLIDSNGIKLACNKAENEIYSAAPTAYAINDSSHRMLRRTSTGYELEYPDFSKELFDTTGKITKSFDKYGEEMLRYVYDSSMRLTSIIYRPQVNVAYKVLSFVYNTETSMLSSVSYVAGGETLLVGNFVAKENGFIIKHYSGVDYDCSIAHDSTSEEFTIFSTERDCSEANDHSRNVACLKTNGNKISVCETRNGSPINNIVYDARKLSGNNEVIILDTTNFHGIMTRVQYEDGQPRYSYEIESANNPIVFSDNVYKGTVSMQGLDGVNGTISTGIEGHRLGALDPFDTIFSLTFSDDTPEATYTGNGILCGWVKHSQDVCPINFMGRRHNIKILQTGQWQYFAIPFANESPTIAFGNITRADFADVKVVFLGKNIQDVSGALYSSTLSKSLKLKDVKFENITEDDILTIENCPATFEDILRYFIGVKKFNRSNEFYYNNGRNFITNAETILICQEYVTDSDMTVVEYFSFSDFDQLTNSIICQDITKTERYYFDEEDAFMTIKRPVLPGNVFIKYDSNLDLIEKRDISTVFLLSHNYLLESCTRNSLGLITSHTVNGNITKQYTYNDDCTKLLSMTDEFDTVVNYTTDDVWGITTKVIVPSITETNSTYTDDGTDLTNGTFGTSGNNTGNNISYADGKVSAMSSGGVSYTFGYTTNDLTSIAKNGYALKNISYEDDYKKVTVSSPTSSSASYSKIATSDNYGRELSISGCRENTYALSPYFDESNQHLDYGDGKGSNSLKTTKDLTNSQITHFGAVSGDQDRIITKSSTDTTISTTNIEKDLGGRMVERTFSSTATGEIKDEITYASFAHMWDTDNRVSSHYYNVAGECQVVTDNIYDGYKRLETKTNTINDIDFIKDIWHNKSRISRVIDKKELGTNTSEISDISYTYDALGRIVSETDSTSGISKSYEYDSIGRLVRENNQELNKTYAYQYNVAGNVKNRKTYAYTTGTLPSSASATDTLSYSTTHPDRLTSYNGKSITYDQQGCPLSYDGKTYTWSRGKLTRIVIGSDAMIKAITPILPVLSSERWDYTYNGNGQRTKKKYTYIPPSNGAVVVDYVSSETVNYTYDHSGRLMHEQTTRVFKAGNTTNKSITYLYDCNTIVGMILNGVKYFFQRNIQGDVVGVYDSTGTKVVGFRYDAFGRCTVIGDVNLAQWCRIRYRGYYYDTETGLYWVQTRYYNPDWCRWISPDSISYLDPESPHGLNLYLYCGNDPVNYVDPSGQGFIAAIAIFIGILVVGGATVGGVSASKAGGTTEEILEGIGKGALNGFVLGAGISLMAAGVHTGTTIAGVLMFSYGTSVTANWLDVAILQSKKSSSEGDSFLAGMHDVTNALYSNTPGIVLGQTEIGGQVIRGQSIVSKSWTMIKLYELRRSTPYNLSALLGGSAGWLGIAATVIGGLMSLNKVLKAIAIGENESGWILY